MTLGRGMGPHVDFLSGLDRHEIAGVDDEIILTLNVAVDNARFRRVLEHRNEVPFRKGRETALVEEVVTTSPVCPQELYGGARVGDVLAHAKSRSSKLCFSICCEE